MDNDANATSNESGEVDAFLHWLGQQLKNGWLSVPDDTSDRLLLARALVQSAIGRLDHMSESSRAQIAPAITSFFFQKGGGGLSYLWPRPDSKYVDDWIEGIVGTIRDIASRVGLDNP